MVMLRAFIFAAFFYAVYRWSPLDLAIPVTALFLAYGTVSTEIEFQKRCKCDTIGANDEQ